MYILEAESSMDAAHFLSGYDGKCGNIHGHRWRVLARVSGEKLMEDKQNRGMVVDFGKLKEDLKEEVDYFDHMFIVEQGSLQPSTIEAFSKEGFTLRMVGFRPTAENFAGYFYEQMKKRGYRVDQITVYETPNNCAVYREESSMFQVVEKFVSINGEGTNAGRIAAFIRFAGCNLNCSFCDTRWANEKDVPFQEESSRQLCDYVIQQGVRFVTLTGGEPLLQKEIGKLTEALLNIEGLTIEFETNGSVSLEELDRLRTEMGQQDRVLFTMDYKLPGSNMQQAMRTENFSYLRKKDTVKFVAGSREDLDTMKAVVRANGLGDRCHVYVSPVFGKIEPANIVDYIINEQLHEVTMQLQMHKFIWDPDKRGV